MSVIPNLGFLELGGWGRAPASPQKAVACGLGTDRRLVAQEPQPHGIPDLELLFLLFFLLRRLSSVGLQPTLCLPPASADGGRSVIPMKAGFSRASRTGFPPLARQVVPC